MLFLVISNELGTESKYSSIRYHQIDSQMEIINQSLGNMLSCIVKNNVDPQECVTPKIEFASSTTCISTLASISSGK